MPSLTELLGFGRPDDPWSQPVSPSDVSLSAIFNVSSQGAQSPSWPVPNPNSASPYSPETNFATQTLPFSPAPYSQSGGLLGPFLALRGGGILQGLFPEPQSNILPEPTVGDPLRPALTKTSSVTLTPAHQPPPPFFLSTFPAVAARSVSNSQRTGERLPLDPFTSPNDFESRNDWWNAALIEAPIQRAQIKPPSDHLQLIARDLSGADFSPTEAHQDTPGLISGQIPIGGIAANAHNSAGEAVWNGKPSDPAVANSYTQAQQIIASDPELSSALRMAENAGDSTFRDRFASIISDLDLHPARALDAIRKEVFGGKVRASTSDSAADAVAFAAIWRAVNRLHEVRPDLGIIWSREAGFRPAVALAEEQRRVLHSIATNPDLTFQEKLDRMADAGLFDAPLASVLAGLGGIAYRRTPLGPADRPGGGRSRISRNLGSKSEAATGREIKTEAAAPTQTAEERRNFQGVGAGLGRIIRGRWWSEVGEAAVPRQVADQLRGQEFRNWAHFRESFWKAVASIPELASQFSSQNRRLMAQGNAPIAMRSHHVGPQREFRLHHVQRIADGGAVYDVDNIRLVSPLQHRQIHYDQSP